MWRMVLLAGLFVAAARVPAASAWDRYQVIMWQPQTETAFAALRRMGVTAGRITPNRKQWSAARAAGEVAPFVQAGLGFYLENIATDFYAPYHRYLPDQPVNALFQATLARWRANPADPAVFDRDPSLVDPIWRARIAERLAGLAASYGPYHPLFYDLGDETGIADLSAAWDFDRSAPALAAFREWLAARYGDLGALDAAWHAQFRTWAEVVPDTTSQALRRPDGELASWADFKAWMDRSFADAVRSGTDALHRADPGAIAGLEGAQLPGWGGYDYATLAPAIDLMEIYPDPVNLEIAQDFHPGLVVLTTSAPDPSAAPAIWRALLRGAGGLVLWDETNALVQADGTPGPHAAAFIPLLRRVEAMAAELHESQPIRDPVAILYSQASFRARWIADARAAGDDRWADRGAEGENADNAWRHAMRAAGTQLLHLGIRPTWVTAEGLARLRPAPKLLLLPQSIALSDADVAAITRFAASGGAVIADVPPGTRDDRLRPRPPLAGPHLRIVPGLWDAADAAHQRVLSGLLAQAGLPPSVVLTTADGEPDANTAIFLRYLHESVVLLLQTDGNPAHDAGPLAIDLDCRRLARQIGLDDVTTVRIRSVVPHVALQEPSEVRIGFPPEPFSGRRDCTVSTR